MGLHDHGGGPGDIAADADVAEARRKATALIFIDESTIYEHSATIAPKKSR